MQSRFRRTIVIKRRLAMACKEIIEANQSVNCDSMQGHEPGTCRLVGIKISAETNGQRVARLTWRVRNKWTLQWGPGDPEVQVYETRSHKYWLKRLVRMTR
jgi:hypothetical protein